MRLSRLSVLAALAAGAIACSSDDTTGLEQFDPGPRDLIVPTSVTVAQDDSALIDVSVVAQGTTDEILSNSGTVFTADDGAVASVGRVESGDLYVFGGTPGTTTVTVDFFGTVKTMEVTVTADPTATLNVSDTDITLFVGQDSSFDVTGTLASGRELTAGRATLDYVDEGDTTFLSFVDPAFAQVVSGTDTSFVLRGLLSPLAPGDVTLTLTSDELSQNITVHVMLRPVDTVELSPSGSAISVGETQALTATLTADNGEALDFEGRTVAWTSSNNAIATVDEDGVVTAVSAGTATITLTVDGTAGTATVLVSD